MSKNWSTVVNRKIVGPKAPSFYNYQRSFKDVKINNSKSLIGNKKLVYSNVTVPHNVDTGTFVEALRFDSWDAFNRVQSKEDFTKRFIKFMNYHTRLNLPLSPEAVKRDKKTLTAASKLPEKVVLKPVIEESALSARELKKLERLKKKAAKRENKILMKEASIVDSYLKTLKEQALLKEVLSLTYRDPAGNITVRDIVVFKVVKDEYFIADTQAGRKRFKVSNVKGLSVQYYATDTTPTNYCAEKVTLDFNFKGSSVDVVLKVEYS